MNRLLFAVGVTCATGLSPAFAQSDPALPGSVLVQPTTTFSSAGVAQNFQYINHPPAPAAPASSAARTGGGRGHKHRQTSGDSGSDGGS